MYEPVRTIPPEHQAKNIGGGMLIVLGILVFLSIFFVRWTPFLRDKSPFVTDYTEVDRFQRERDSEFSGLAIRAIVGMVLIVAGIYLRVVGSSKKDGSTIFPDPEAARRPVRRRRVSSHRRTSTILEPEMPQRDLEPLKRITGGMANDALSEVDAFKPKPSEPIVRLRCRKCGGLNDESAKFCNQCGTAI